MNLSKYQNSQKSNNSNYWGVRDLNFDEIVLVGGGYDGDNGPSSGGPDSNNVGGSAGSPEAMADAASRQERADEIARDIDIAFTDPFSAGLGFWDRLVKAPPPTGTTPMPEVDLMGNPTGQGTMNSDPRTDGR